MADDPAEWLEWRRGGIGGSDVAAVLGLSPWVSPYSLWAEKVGLVPGQEQNASMEFGLRAEPMLEQWFKDKTGLVVAGRQRRVMHPTNPWMRCTLDADVLYPLAGSNDMAEGIAEWKTTSEPAWEKVPDYYACQATWNMIVTGTRKCWFGVLHLAFGRPDFQVYEFDLHDGDAEFITAACEAFWNDHVLTGTPPDVDSHEATTDALTAMWPEATGTVEADEATVQKLAQLTEWEASAKAITEQVDRLKNELRLALGDAEVLTVGGEKRASWKWESRTTLDAAGIRAEHPEIADAYQKITRSRVLRLTKEKH